MEDQEVSSEEPPIIDRSISVKALRRDTKKLLSALLNPEKIIPSDKGYPRDWHGLAELCGISGEKIPSLQRDGDPTCKILEIWGEENNSSTIDQLLCYLEDLDRYDIIDDITPLVDQDIEVFHRNPNGFVAEPIHIDDRDILTIDDIRRKEQGLSPQIYDAFVLFADDDIDFSTELVETMEKQYNLKLCVKHRDLVGGTFEYDTIIQLISNRCGRLVVVISPAFFQSPANKFFCSFAQVQGIEQRKRKIIPCLYKRCTSLPPELSIYFLLDYARCARFCNFWDKLYSSIVAPQASSIQAISTKATESITAKPLKTSKSIKSTNHVKFISNEPVKVVDDVANDVKPSSQIIKPVEEVVTASLTPNSSCTSLNSSSNTMEIRKSKSFYKRIKNIFNSKCSNNNNNINRIVEVPPQEEDCQKVNGFVVTERKKPWKSWKMKVAVAN